MTQDNHLKSTSPNTLSIDIGGTGVKMMVLDANGKAITEYYKLPTPKPATPNALIELIQTMIKHLDTPFGRASAGFPGVVHQGVVKTAPNLDASFPGTDFQKMLEDITQVPVRVANDADVQGYGDISGEGVELVITLGTGFGSALFINGHLVPNLEMGHHPLENGLTYEELLGKKAFEKTEVNIWCQQLKRAIQMLDQTFNYDKLYLGGGLANEINFTLPGNVKKSCNIEGVLGGIKLWEE